jgi:hypothetical protein
VTRRERLLARALPTAVVHLRTLGDGEPEPLELRALPADEFEQLMREHPPTDEQRGDGAAWNHTTFLPALLAASEVPCDGEEPLGWADWAQLLGSPEVPGLLAFGEREDLIGTALALNDRAPAVSTGNG